MENLDRGPFWAIGVISVDLRGLEARRRCYLESIARILNQPSITRTFLTASDLPKTR